MITFTVDVETNILNTGDNAVGSFKASPFSKDNGIVMLGEKLYHPSLEGEGGIYADVSVVPAVLQIAQMEDVLLVGHNVGFDLLYMMKTWPEEMHSALKNLYIWDTQQVAYLMSGQSHMFPSLDECTAELGLELKDDKIKEYWENGVDTAFIPPEELKSYLEGDLRNTEAVFKYQWLTVQNEAELLNLVRVKMDDILLTTMMEHNGMHFDLPRSHDLSHAASIERDAVDVSLMDMAREFFVNTFTFNPASNEQVSLMMFGGTYIVVEDRPKLDEHGKGQVYKTGAKAGQVKMVKTPVAYYTPGLALNPGKMEKNAKGNYSVGEDVLRKYKDVVFVDAVLRFRSLEKDIETYYKGYSSLVWPQDSCIHPSFNHAATRTGRQSCSKPNLQNVTSQED